jgi:hypothetical protein
VKTSSRSRLLPSRSAFAGFRFPTEVVVVAVRWYLRYGLSGTVALSHPALLSPQILHQAPDYGVHEATQPP